MAVQRASRPQKSRSSAASGGFRGFLEAAWDRTRRIAAGFGRFVRSYYFAIAFVLALLIVLVGGGYIQLSFPPFETYGTIYVGSPEVYTRERLVNDRYDQDFWYRTQLGKLDESDSLLTAYLETATRLGVKGIGAPERAPAENVPSTDSDSPPTANPEAADPPPSTPFDQEFRIRAGIRDHIRQLILENMLDDRHDLTGNSIYGLKFDTTVLPGTNTYRRAFVRVAISNREPILDKGGARAVPQLLRLYYDNPTGKIDDNPSERIRESFDLYGRWLRNVGLRLNEYTQTAYYKQEYSKESCKEEEIQRNVDDFTRDILSSVLSINLGRGGDLGEFSGDRSSIRIYLPEIWSNLLTIDRRGGTTCQDGMPWFEVRSVVDNVYLFPKSNGAGIPDWAKSSFSGFIENRTWIAATNISGMNPSNFNNRRLHYNITFPTIDFARNAGKVLRYCQLMVSNKGCAQEIAVLPVESGFFNFAKAINATDSYVYALFPKSESVAYRSDATLSTDVSGGGGEVPGVLANFFRRVRGTSSEAVFVGYVDGVLGRTKDQQSEGAGGTSPNFVQFGWVISGLGRSPVEKSTLALVSVPAWIDKLELTISIGWLDRNSNEDADPPFQVIVPVPPDYEALDSFVTEGKSVTGPKILDAFFGKVELFACEPAKLVVPGYRLWRSTTVVVGSQPADRITVLPNMQGVVAQFNRIDIPDTPIKDGKAESRLRVWTSEGVDEVSDAISIRVPAPIEAMRACPDEGEQKNLVELPTTAELPR